MLCIRWISNICTCQGTGRSITQQVFQLAFLTTNYAIILLTSQGHVNDLMTFHLRLLSRQGLQGALNTNKYKKQSPLTSVRARMHLHVHFRTHTQKLTQR